VVQYIEAIGAAPLILREEITTGIASETLEDVAERIGFAVVLLTPDDVAHPASKPEDNRQRPSQNVVLELGYLAAKLGRSKILVFTNGDIELPNYVLGLNCEAIDRNEGWKLCLARELKNAGFQVDLNGAL
jgi:predicted nucleotide-binding protein